MGEETTEETACPRGDTNGQRIVRVASGNCRGAGCVNSQCGYCIYNMNTCTRHYGNACYDVNNARSSDHWGGCWSSLLETQTTQTEETTEETKEETTEETTEETAC